jgi:hypothetical protein
VIRSGSFGSVKELVREIDAYLTGRNAAPKPYRWKAKGAGSLPRSTAPAPPSTMPRRLCEDF